MSKALITHELISSLSHHTHSLTQNTHVTHISHDTKITQTPKNIHHIQNKYSSPSSFVLPGVRQHPLPSSLPPPSSHHHRRRRTRRPLRIKQHPIQQRLALKPNRLGRTRKHLSRRRLKRSSRRAHARGGCLVVLSRRAPSTGATPALKLRIPTRARGMVVAGRVGPATATAGARLFLVG